MCEQAGGGGVVCKLCVSKLCVSKLCVDKLCVSRWEEAEGEAEEEGGSAGVPNQKQEPHTKMWGKMQQFCETSSILVSLRQSKTKEFCETSSMFQVDNIKNEATLRDFLQQWKVECRADGLVPMRFAIFPLRL